MKILEKSLEIRLLDGTLQEFNEAKEFLILFACVSAERAYCT